MMKAFFKAIAICLFMTLAASAFADESPLTHRLEKGETLYSISRKYSIPYEALAAANGITDPTKLRIGSVLVIPSIHVVLKGETLYGISKQYGVSLTDLLAANKLTSGYVLKVSDVLIIPGTKKAEGDAQPPLSTPSTTLAAQSTATTKAVAVTTTTMSTTTTAAKPSPTTASVPMPEPVKTQDRVVDMKLNWPAPGKAMYLDGKLEGIMIRVKPGDSAKTIASGIVVSAGPSRGFNQVVFIQAKSGYVYVYGGNETLSVKTGDQVPSGKEIGKIGIDAKDGSAIAYFFVFRNGQPIDPALAPRD